MNSALQLARAVLFTDAPFQEKLSGFGQDFDCEATFAETRVDMALQGLNVVIENRLDGFGIQRLLGDDGVDAVDEFGREPLAHGAQRDTLKPIREFRARTGRGRLKPNVGVYLLHHLARAEIAGKED